MSPLPVGATNTHRDNKKTAQRAKYLIDVTMLKYSHIRPLMF